MGGSLLDGTTDLADEFRRVQTWSSSRQLVHGEPTIEVSHLTLRSWHK